MDESDGHDAGDRRMTFEEWMKNQDPAIIKDAFSAAAGWNAGQTAERESSDEPVGYVWESHFMDTGKPIKLFLETPEFPPGVVSDLPIVPVYKHPPPTRKLTDEAMKLFRDIERRINGEKE